MKTILMISHSSNATGGGEDDFYRLQKHLYKKYNIIGVFPPGERQRNFESYSHKYIIIPDGIFPFTGFNVKKYLYYLYTSFKKIKILYPFLKSIRSEIDVAFVNSSVCLSEIFVLNLLKIKYVLSIKEKIEPLIPRIFIYNYYGFTAKKIIFISNFLRKSFIKIADIKYHKIIYSAIEDDIFKNKKMFQKKGIVKNAEYFSIINIGTISPLKNQELLINSAKYINSRKKIKIKIIGKIVDRKYYDYLLRKANKISNEKLLIEIKNEVSKEEILEEMCNSECVVISSKTEGMSLVLVEALALQKAIITTKVGVVEEVLENKISGLVLCSNDEKELAKNIRLLIDDEEIKAKLENNSIEVFKKYFNMEKYLEEHENYIIQN